MVEAADQPALLLFGFVAAVDGGAEILVDLVQTEQASARIVEDDGGKVVVEETPLPACAIGSALKKDLEGIVSGDADASAATRLRLNQQLADTDTLLVPAHFPGTTAGHVIGAGDGFGFKFIDG